MTNEATVNPTLCQLVELPNGVHEVILYKNDHRAAEAWVAVMESIYQNAGSADSVRILLNVSQTGLLPVKPVMNFARDVNRKFPDLPPIRVAIIVRKEPLLMIFPPLIERIRRLADHVRFFHPEQREEAIQWLLNSITESSA